MVEERVEEKADDERDTQIKLLSMTVQQHSVNMAVEVQKRDALEAELRQALTETRFELRQLQQSRAKSIDAPVSRARVGIYTLVAWRYLGDVPPPSLFHGDLSLRSAIHSGKSAGRTDCTQSLLDGFFPRTCNEPDAANVVHTHARIRAAEWLGTSSQTRRQRARFGRPDGIRRLSGHRALAPGECVDEPSDHPA